MRIPTPEHIKSAIIDVWLRGETRDNIASKVVHVGEGTVSNVLKEWQNRIGVFEAKSLRKLGLALKKAGMTPVQCANSLRISNILNQLGIDENHLIDFLNKIYNACNEQRLPLANLVKLVKVIDNHPEINSLNEIPKIIKKRRQEKINLDQEIYYKKLEIQKLDREKERKRKEIQDLQDELESFKKEIQNEKKEFMLFKDAKAELMKHDIQIQTLEPLINVIKIFEEKHFRPLTILCEFSDINDYRNLVENKNKKLNELELRIQDLKTTSDNYEMKIKSKQKIVQSLNQLENFGFDVSDIKNLEMVFSDISKKYSLDKKEIKIRFFKYIISYFNNFVSLQQDIFERINNVSILDSEISSRRKVIESQPIAFSILQNLVDSGFSEHEILMIFNIFKTDLINNMPYGDRTYFERLSKDLNKYPTVRDTVQGLNNKILIKKSYIDKLTLIRSNLEVFLYSLVMNIIYFYSTILLNAQQQVQQIQIQKNNTIKRILLIYFFNYLLLPLLFLIVIKEAKKSLLDQNSKQKSKIKKTKKIVKTKKSDKK